MRRRATGAISHVNIVDNLLRPVDAFIDDKLLPGSVRHTKGGADHGSRGLGALWRALAPPRACLPAPPLQRKLLVSGCLASRLPIQPWDTLGCPGLWTMTHFDGNVPSGSAQALGAFLGPTEFTSAPYRPNTLRHSHHRDLWWRFLRTFLLSKLSRLTLMQDSPNAEVRDAGGGKMSQPHYLRQYLPPLTTLAKASQLGNKTSTEYN